MAEQIQKGTVAAKDNTKGKQEVTVTFPAPVNVSVSGNVTVQPVSTSGSHETLFYQTPEWWLVVATGVLVYVTARLVSFTKRLWQATVDLAKEARSTSERQASEMQNSLRIAEKAADAAKESAEITNFTFKLTNRPRLIVRWIYLVDERTVQFEITNVGEIGARVLGVHGEMSMDNLPAKAPYPSEGKIGGISPTFIHAGQAHEVRWKVVEEEAVTEFQKELGWNEAIAEDPNYHNDAKKIYFLGYITYEDENIHIRHRTAFCRLYDYKKRRFMPLRKPDPDYEHCD